MRILYPGHILILAAAIALVIGIFLSVTINKTFDEPATCARCHEMEKYVATYLNPGNGSIIQEHGSDCFGCHANTSRQRAKDAVLKQIGISALNKMTGFNFNSASPDLAVNCAKCHVLKSYSHLNFTKIAGCIDCHWAHTPSSVSLNPYSIPSGPHRNQTCSNCHGKGYKVPRCLNCHKGHGEQELENDLCLSCHVDPHLPFKPGILPGNTVNFTKDMPYSLCSPCHKDQYDELNMSHSRHLDMQTCAQCHDTHGKLPRCSGCHSKNIAHGHTILQCYNCHGGNRFSGPGGCTGCHGETHEWNAITAFRPVELNEVNDTK